VRRGATLIPWFWVALAAADAPAHVTQARDAIDWERAGDEAVRLLSEYLQVDTTNPPGNEDRGVAWLGAQLDAAGIPWEAVPHGEGRSSLIARVDGGDSEAPLCLMHHIDVASYEVERWPEGRGPLSGVIADGALWGRGALDMKGMGALELMTLRLLVEQGVPLRRDVIMLAVADEEVDNLGARELAARWSEIGCSQMINEGGLGVVDALFEGQAVHAISTAEKGILWVAMHADGRAGHGSTPHPDEAPSRLLEAMARIDAKVHPRATIDPSLYALLDAVGRQKGGLTGAVLRSKPLVATLVKPRLKAEPTTDAVMRDTVHLTGLRGAESPNVVPGRVTAQYDCRLLPGTTPQEHLARLQRAVRGVEGISFEVLAEAESNSSPASGPLFDALVAYAVEGRPYAAAGPLLAVGFTDSLLLRPLGVEAYGYVPFEVEAEVAETMHGHGERVPVDQVHEGLRRLFSVVVHAAGQP
jgi:acetylornithine deacetylase/succinyl-diaminopimelate desuccinylase-like protein